MSNHYHLYSLQAASLGDEGGEGASTETCGAELLAMRPPSGADPVAVAGGVAAGGLGLGICFLLTTKPRSSGGTTSSVSSSSPPPAFLPGSLRPPHFFFGLSSSSSESSLEMSLPGGLFLRKRPKKPV